MVDCFFFLLYSITRYYDKKKYGYRILFYNVSVDNRIADSKGIFALVDSPLRRNSN